MPSILQFCAVDYTAYFLLRPLGIGLKEKGYRVTFCCRPGRNLDKLSGEGFDTRGLKVSRNYNIFAHTVSFIRLYLYLKRNSFDAVHTHTPVASLIGRLAAKAAGVDSVIYTAHGFYFHERMNRLARRIYIWLERIGGVLSDLIFVQSMEDYREAEREGIAPPEKLVHIGNGIRPELFGEELYRGRTEDLKEELNIGSEPVVGFVGRMVREKGLFELVTAAAEVRKSFRDARFLLVGEELKSERGRYGERLRQLIGEKGLEGNVILAGKRDDVPALLALMDIFVLPSYREGMPRSILEAMASSLPVVASDIRGCREEVDEGRTGLLVDPGDIKGLADAICELLADPDRARTMGRKGREKVLIEYDESVIIKKQIDYIDRLTGKRSKRNCGK
jgi:glycosyltransferase involved in cell wall biosynthesis